MENSPTDEYRALMKSVKSPSAVHEGILAQVERARREERRTARAPHARRPGVGGGADGGVGAKPRRWKPVAAGVCAIVLAAALIPLGGQLLETMGGGGGGAAAQSFSVRAYASATRTLVPPTDNGMIVFERSGGLTWSDKDWYLKYGKYTGCMFTVEGEGIVRIQATTSAGMLYRNRYETINAQDDPERVAEVTHWKPTKAGLGEYYGLYENIQIRDGFGETAPGEMTLKLTKMLGSTIDLPINAQDDSDAKSFGLWTNEDYGDVTETADDPLATTDAMIDTFEGETITVTAYFQDGSCATQVIELHAADFKATFDDPSAFYGYGTITVYPEVIDHSTLPNVFAESVNEGAPFALHSLYGVIVDESDEPHPYPLDNANEWLDKTVPFTFERREAFTSMGDATLEDASISDPSGKVTCFVSQNWATSAQGDTPYELELANLRIERSDTLPFGLTPEDTTVYGSYQGDMAYANKVLEESLGYRIGADGTVTSGYSYRAVTFAATNRSDADVSLSPSALGTFAVLDDAEGHYATAGAAVVWVTGYDGAANSYADCTLAPGETRELTVVYIVPDAIDQHDNPLFCFFSFYGPNDVGEGVLDDAAFRIKSLL